MLDVTQRRIGVVIACAVGSTWGFLSFVSFAHPDPFHPISFIDYVAVVSYSVALAALAPAAWLIARVAGRAMARGRRAIMAALAAATLVGALTFWEGGVSLIVGTWLVAGVAMWRGPGAVVRATAIIMAVGAPVAVFGNLIEDGFQMKDVGGALFVVGLGGTLIGLLGLTAATALAGRFALAGLCAATVAGILASQYGGGLVVLAAWLGFAGWIARGQEGLTIGGQALTSHGTETLPPRSLD